MGAAITSLVKAIVADYQDCPQREAERILTPLELLTKLYPGAVEADEINDLVAQMLEAGIPAQVKDGDGLELVYSLKKKVKATN